MTVGPDVVSNMVGHLGFQVDDRGLKEFDRGLDQAKKGSDELGVSGVALGNVLGNITTKALELGVALVQSAAAAVHDLVVEFGASTKELDAWAKRISIAPEQLQRLEFAAKSVGAEAEDVREGLQTWQENLGEFTRLGSGPAVDSLKSLGLRIEDLQGLAPEDSLKIFADALMDLPSEAERVSIAMEVMGTEGSKLAPLLQQGAGGIQALMDKADELGQVLDESAIQKGLETQAALGGIDKTTQALKNTIAVALAPVVTDLADRFGDWYRANEEVIAQRVPEVIDEIVAAGQGLIEWGQELSRGLENIASLFGRMGDEGEGAGNRLVEMASTAVEWSKAGLEGFVEWTDEVAEMAELIWDVAKAIKDGLVTAYEDYLEPVVDTVTASLNDQESVLGRVVAFAEQMVERVLELRDQVRGLVDDIGLSRIGERVGDDVRAPVEAARARAEADRAAEDEARRIGEARAQSRKAAIVKEIADTKDTKKLRALLARTTDPDLRETIERRIRGERFRRKTLAAAAGGGGEEKVDTREAERMLGDEIRILGQGVGASDKAQRAALEAAAKSLNAGDSLSVARTAATSALGKSTGLDLSGASGPEAALFRELTQIGGVEAARSATDGAKFVNIDQSVTVTVGDIRLAIPESYAQGLTDTQFVSGVESALQRVLADRVFSPIVDSQAARSARP